MCSSCAVERDQLTVMRSSQDAGDLLNSLLPSKAQSAAQPTPPPQAAQGSTLTPEEKKAENQRRAEMLRAQLLAKRQHTPAMPTPKASMPSAETPVRQVTTPATKPAEAPMRQTVSSERPTDAVTTNTNAQLDAAASNDSLGLDSLIAEGRAAAEAKSKEQATLHANGKDSHGNALSSSTSEPTPPLARTNFSPQGQRTEPVAKANGLATEKKRPFQLTDAYYADLPAWLEITGYHDVEYRASKLRTYKARRELEQEKARIEAEIARLNREEEEERIAIRASVAPSTPAAANVPLLPSTMPTDDQAAVHITTSRVMTGSSLKRAHSPPPNEKSARRREDVPPLSSTNGFRIRGANDHSPTSNSSGAPNERRVSYPDARPARSRSPERARDPSLERRQSYYRRDSGPPPNRNGIHYDKYTPPSRPYGGTRGPPHPPAPYGGSWHPNESTLREYRIGRPPALQYGDGASGGNGAPRR